MTFEVAADSGDDCSDSTVDSNVDIDWIWVSAPDNVAVIFESGVDVDNTGLDCESVGAVTDSAGWVLRLSVATKVLVIVGMRVGVLVGPSVGTV